MSIDNLQLERVETAELPLPKAIKTPTGQWGKLQAFQPGEGRSHKIEMQPVDGIEITPFSDLNEEEKDLVKERLMRLIGTKERLSGEHYNNLTGGLLIRITKNVLRPLFITHRFAGEQSCWHTLILAAPGTQAKIVERFEGESGGVSHVVEAFLEERANVAYANTQRLAKGTFHARRTALLESEAAIDWFELNANKEQTYSRVKSRLSGKNCETSISSLFLGEKNHFDVGAEAAHQGEQGRSKLVTRGVLASGATSIYEGALRIGRAAAKSDAFQDEGTLLLDQGCEAKASPMLYIDNNDVRCSHAATTSKPDEEQLFYLQARGLSEQQAKRLLIKAYLWPAVEAIPAYARQSLLPLIEPIINEYAAEGRG